MQLEYWGVLGCAGVCGPRVENGRGLGESLGSGFTTGGRVLYGGKEKSDTAYEAWGKIYGFGCVGLIWVWLG
jgi:hypothetical protein